MAFARHLPVTCVLWYAMAWSLSMGNCTAGSYLRDVELIAPSPQAELNTVYYYPSYVKGEDPVEEYNRRRLHVDTTNFMEPETDRYEGDRLQKPPRKVNVADEDDDCCWKAKRKRKYRARMRQPKTHATAPMVDTQTDHEYNYRKIRKSTDVPRYVRDDVEIFDVDRGNRIREKRPIRRRTRMAPTHRRDAPRRYEESDPQVFAYERADTEPIGRANPNPGGDPEDSKYFQDTFQFQKSPLELEFGHLFESNNGWEERFAEIFGDGSYAAGARRGNDQHYLEQLERGWHGGGVFQKKVKWADKKGGFGEHYWDLNHIQPADSSG